MKFSLATAFLLAATSLVHGTYAMDSEVPSTAPTGLPTEPPTTENPTGAPTTLPTTASPTDLPTVSPTDVPTGAPTNLRTRNPTVAPTGLPATENPTGIPTSIATGSPTTGPTAHPTVPTTEPPVLASTGTVTDLPTSGPTERSTTSSTSVLDSFGTFDLSSSIERLDSILGAPPRIHLDPSDLDNTGGRKLQFTDEDSQACWEDPANPYYFYEWLRSERRKLPDEERALYKVLTNEMDVPYFVLFANHWYATTDDFPSREIERATNRELRQLKRFWKMQDYDVRLQAFSMHQLKDTELMVEAFTNPIIGMPEDYAREYIAYAQNAMEIIGYDNPLWTAEALSSAADAPGEPSNPTGAKLTIGLGLYELEKSYEGSTAFTLYHEFGHHVGFPLGVFSSDPEITVQYLELFADAAAAYYAFHPRGGNINAFESFGSVESFMKTVPTVGDCDFYWSGHAGTYNQKIQAAEFGNELANESFYGASDYDFWFLNRRKAPLSPEEFKARFDEVYPKITADW